MKYMGGWTYPTLMQTPADVVRIIAEMIAEDDERQREAGRS